MSDYRSLRMRHKVRKFHTGSDLQNGTWVPVSIEALLSDYSTQSLRMFGFKGLIETGRFRVGPLLVNLRTLEGLKKA